jgi:homoserine O-acetyltransferase
VILLFHALSGTQHAAGYNPRVERAGTLWQEELHEGWWTDYIGPGLALDTDHYFVICINYLGGCYGSTGPMDIDPRTGKRYAGDFPHLRAADQCVAQARLLDELGIGKCHAVIGASLGGLLAVTFATLYPERVTTVVPIASGVKTTVLNRLLLFEQILAIENDPHFHGGNFYDGPRPEYGLALARSISHKTFIHLDTIEERASSKIRQSKQLSWYEIKDAVQSYMMHQGTKFVHRFDANTYLRLCELWSVYDPLEEAGAETMEELFARSAEANHRYLVFSVDSDFCFYPEEQSDLVAHLKKAGVRNTHITVHSEKGHDSFLLEPWLFSPHLSYSLAE